MLTLWGPGGHTRYCDGLSRRSFLKIGGLAMGGLSLPGLLQAETRGQGGSPSGTARSSHKSVIMVYLSGGLAAPGHVRPQARGPRRHPRRVQADRDPAARRPDQRAAAPDRRRRWTRSPSSARSSACATSTRASRTSPASRWARASARGSRSFGSVIAQDARAGQPGRPAVRRPVPGHAAQALQQPRPRLPRPRLQGGADGRRRPGAAASPRRTSRPRDSIADAACSASSTSSAARSTTPRPAAWTTVYRRAFDVLTSDKVARALDVTREDPRLRDRYGIGSPTPPGRRRARCGTTSS